MSNNKKGYKGKVQYRAGLAIDQDGRGIESQTDAWKKDADCGCGIDCCEKQLVLQDQTTGDFMALFFADGSPFYRNLTTGGDPVPIASA